jgi:hypothetical protein
MRRGFIPVDVHMAIEPFAVPFFIAAPWIFGFSHVEEAKWVSIGIGALMGIASLMTDWRYSLAKVVSLRMHWQGDVAMSIFLVASPFIFGFSDDGAATRFMVISGVLEFFVTNATRWVVEQGGTRPDTRGPADATS